jgi:hypothetical protein
MADPNTVVNPQVSDAVTSTNLNVVGASPAQAMSIVYQGVASATNLAIQNAQYGSQQLNQIGQAVTAVACDKIMKLMDKP